MADNVNHPAHYKSASGLEAIDVIDAFCADLKGTEAVCTANALKYILRWKHKNGVEDLEKAQWYLDHLIGKIEGEVAIKSADFAVSHSQPDWKDILKSATVSSDDLVRTFENSLTEAKNNVSR